MQTLKSLKNFIWPASRSPAQNTHLEEDPSKGYLSVRLGDTLHDGRYAVLRKFGYGQYSTVWLAKDTKTQRHAILKILRDDCYNGEHDIFELGILKHIAQQSKSSRNPGRLHVGQLLNDFAHIRSDGTKHVCMVLDILGGHLGHQTAKSLSGSLPNGVAKRVAMQMLQALDFLHTECGVIHTDIQPSNILLKLADQELMVSRYLKTTSPRIAENEGSESVVPLREVLPSPLLSSADPVDVALIDFGVASWTDKHLSDRIQPPILRAPEVTLGAPWGPSVDIWNLGCLIFELVTHRLSFPGKDASDGSYTAEDDRLALLMEVFGQFPPSFLAKCKRREEFFDSDSKLLRIPKFNSTPLSKLVDGATETLKRPDDMPADEVILFCDFLEQMLALDPEERRTAGEMLLHPWLSV